ncbi:carbohydrate ABC transporter permease [Kribbella italica]|uniref:Multiple sugar transport system permease protein n=1 Tax=Kribbella italica TaxID=1540520 RepID=A0A7W9J0B8_9ACTN|nr:carbohydrate ABC transporter permease [Kribbella italica]MBB5833306.1 multiple sugar transport system permease protein [Kribbella italica]
MSNSTASSSETTVEAERPRHAGDRDPAPGRPRRRRGVAGLALRYLLLCVGFVFLAGPFLWQLSTSLKGPTENIFDYPPQLIPAHPTLQNFAEVADTIPVWQFAGNSLMVAVAAATTNCLFGSMAGYALARMKFRGRTAAYWLFLSTMVIPFEVIMVSVFLTARSLGLVDTLAGVILPTAVTGLSILLMRNAFLALPRELEEAAILDGTSEWQRFWRVAMPSVRGTLSVVAIFSFMFAWDDFLWPLIVLKNPDNYTLTVGIQYLSGTFTSNQRVIAAGTMIALIPLLALFFSLQKYFFRGVGEGAVKG